MFGQFDEHLKLIERTVNVTLISRDGMLKILGTEQSATQAKKLIEELVTLAGRGNTITRQNVSYALSLAMEERNQVLTEIDKDFICNTIQVKGSFVVFILFPLENFTPSLSKFS